VVFIGSKHGSASLTLLQRDILPFILSAFAGPNAYFSFEFSLAMKSPALDRIEILMYGTRPCLPQRNDDQTPLIVRLVDDR